MKESGQVSLYIEDFSSLMSRIGDCGERAYIHVYRRGLASRFLDQLTSHPGNLDSLQELMDITLELDTRYHEGQKEKVIIKIKPHASLLNKDDKSIGSEKERRIKEGLCNYCGRKHPFGKCFKRPENTQGSSKGFPRKQGKA
ncbi:hypothetical protein O181_070723 [Austropuccinia psidii MF-1]|uniref:Retrotransposon gag domain-containing protein n=1 Tax=Austropuccinia psidii MF-1 TaxID=1389203 RepID=A0A9Q3I7J1_9BASI|nr:hypothetical protein [Austropuccinia psidii MF-1]